MTTSKEYNFIDLFSGCGGFSLGLIKSGLKGIFCIEKDPWAFETFSHNLIDRGFFDWPKWLPKEPIDIYNFEKTHLEKVIDNKIDIVVGCPPCQGFSYRGKRKSNDQRNFLYKPMLNIAFKFHPKIILFENVIGITKTFKNESKIISSKIEKKLINNDYIVYSKIVNCADFGIPQIRKRFFIWALDKNYIHNINESNPFTLLYNKKDGLIKNIGLDFAHVTTNEAIGDLLKGNGVYEDPEFNKFYSGLYSKPFSKYQLLMRQGLNGENPDSHRFPNHYPHIEQRFKKILDNCEKGKCISKPVKKKLDLPDRSISILESNKPSMTITSLPDDILHYEEPRILTVRETARIQSFPDVFKFKGNYTTGGKERVKQCPRYTQVANAVPPLLAQMMGNINIDILDAFYEGETFNNGK